PGLAKGGTGDVLTGVIAAFLGQGLTPIQATTLGAYVHGKASELLTQRFGQSRSSLASEVASAITDVLAGLECPK
ncbi:bifunctional ADP-dependent NAD(P)H-hydrate dehydratase/NAD(P)H-hydrate epimerase, partial [bacterium]|nr:bifunctional ADP-dependent NAD(P)H-hydrate dehydratase/NAD(P)H-hydrate epimerase [bacterium]